MTTLENWLQNGPVSVTASIPAEKIPEEFTLGPFPKCSNDREKGNSLVEELLAKAVSFYRANEFVSQGKPCGQTFGAERGIDIATVAMTFYHTDNTIRVSVLRT